MWKIIRTGLYLILLEVVSTYLIVFPVYAFLISSSSTGYVRVATAASVGAYQAATRSAFVSAAASAISAPTAASVALRIATGPVGWAVLGVSAAIVLANMYYSAAEISTLKSAALAAQPSVITVPGAVIPPGSTLTGCTPLVAPCNQILRVPNARTFEQCTAIGQTSLMATPPGWGPLGPSWPSGGPCRDTFQYSYNGANPGGLGTSGAPTSLTQTQAETYVNGLASGNASSIESNTEPVGQGVTAPAADNVTTVQVSPSQVAPTVKPATSVLPTDSVIDPNAPPPTGPQPVTTPTSTTTTTTTTTTNPDGSTTTQDTEAPGVMSCSIGNHDQRTFGSILQTHMAVWQGSGLVSALNLIKNLTWPETIPTYALSSTIFGAFTLDFSSWSGMLLALRGLVIAIASFVAYRIIFVGSK